VWKEKLQNPEQRVTLGNERLLGETFSLIAGKRLGLITNPSGVDAWLRPTADQLHQAQNVELVALFGPEHGIRGYAADGATVDAVRDQRTGVLAHSLYGARRQPDEAMLRSLDALVFDIQDVGVRFYTYLYTMSLSMAACAHYGLQFIVLDRPNPIGGIAVEGNVLDPAFASFVGLYPIPIRYGMSLGELARLFNEVFSIGVELHVVEMRGWRRLTYWEETGLPWLPPSPNMPTVDTAVVYPGMCYFEGTNISEGRGTTKPFEQVGAPFIEAERLADRLNALELPGALFRPVYFQPSASKYAGHTCQGVQVHVLNRQILQPVRTGLETLATIKKLWPGEFAWHIPQGGIHNFDRLAGTDQLRLALDAGTPVDEILAGWEEDLQQFKNLRENYLLY
jgi:uncharacterized protein YbbC (DUF1343 family)